MNKYPPEKFFQGSQLMLAQAIADENLSEVERLAPVTALNIPGAQDMTLLFFALQQAQARKATPLVILGRLVQKGADPLLYVPDMGSVAGVAAASPYPEYMQALLDGGLDVNAKIQDQPLLFNAASDNTLKTLALMVDRGADINAANALGSATIMEALDGMQLDTVEWLLNRGANPNVIETNTGWSFMRQLDNILQREGSGTSATHNKLMQIYHLALQKGGRSYR